MITADTRKAVFLLHQEGTPIRQISRQLRLSRNAVRGIIAQSGQMPASIRRPSRILDPELLRQLHPVAGEQQRAGWCGRRSGGAARYSSSDLVARRQGGTRCRA